MYGEGERGLCALAGRLAAGATPEDPFEGVPNLVWQRDGTTVLNAPEWVHELDELPFPAWELMPPASFPCVPANGYSRRFPIAPITMTRGCPCHCTYCGAAQVNGRQIRSRSPENVLEEIRLLTSQYGVRELNFFDSNCAHPKAPLRAVCQGICDAGIDITWSTPNGIRLEAIDEEFAALMKRSGCFQVSVGIESGSLRILKADQERTVARQRPAERPHTARCRHRSGWGCL